MRIKYFINFNKYNSIKIYYFCLDVLGWGVGDQTDKSIQIIQPRKYEPAGSVWETAAGNRKHWSSSKIFQICSIWRQHNSGCNAG